MLFVTLLDPFFSSLFYDRDALLRTYPTCTHLMCYFHVVKNCKDRMKGRPKDVHESIMNDIHYLHSSSSENEFQVRLTEAVTKWHNEEPGFAEILPESMENRGQLQLLEDILQCSWSGCYQQCSRIFQQNYQEEFYLRYMSFASCPV